MKRFTELSSPEIIQMLRTGAIGVIRTDTLYGVVAMASSEIAVERVYSLKNRDDSKSPIVLIASLDQMFDEPPGTEQDLLEKVWPGPVSVIVPSKTAPKWISRGNGSVAYRLPADDKIRSLLEQTGPLIAPSANPESKPPAMTVDEAVEYFGDSVDFYVDGGEVTNVSPSQLLRIGSNGEVERLR